MQLSTRDLLARDRFVVAFFRERGIPLVVLYGGGYNREKSHTAKLHTLTIRTAAIVA